MCSTCGCSGSDHTHTHDHSHDHHHDHSHDHHDHPHHHDNGDGQTSENIALEADILGENNRHAAWLRGYFAGRGITAYNLVSSPGSGKTSLLEALVKAIAPQRPVAVIEGDQQTDNDAARISACGVPAHQINTAGGCHLDAHMVIHALDSLQPQPGSILFIENVGNLVCPAMFDLGERHRIVVVSVTEGDDKPLKYPYMFRGSDVCVINKIDLLPYLDSDVELLKANVAKVNPGMKFFEVSATKGTGIDALVAWLLGE